jgi:hypothetical protein
VVKPPHTSIRLAAAHELVLRGDLKAYVATATENDLDELKWSFIDPIIRKHLLAAELEIQERAPGTKLVLLTMPGTRLGWAVSDAFDDLRRRAPLLLVLALLIAIVLGIWLVDRAFD